MTYFGGKGMGCFKSTNGSQPAPVKHDLFDKTNSASIVVSRSHGSDRTTEVFKEMGVTVKEEIPSGSSIKLCLVADGTADLYPRLGPTMEWDTAAGDCIYRYSCKSGTAPSSLKYNKEVMKNPEFILGL
ncbi:MAG: inositol monophosphatase family protein [Balneolales bacterium]